jgi:hypothetical protein
MSQVAAGSKKSDPLRQQLDELDQLMERMLALGVQPAPAQVAEERTQRPEASQASGAAAPEPILSQKANESAPPAEFSLPEEVPYHQEFDLHRALSETTGIPVELAGPDAEPERGSEIELAPPAPTFVSLEGSATVPAAPLFAEFQFAPSPALAPLEPAEAPTAPAVFKTAPPPEPVVLVAWWLQPLAIVSRIYDGSTAWLGPIGRGLRSRPMRNLLGICGLACMIGALAWMLWEGTDWNS